MRIVFMGTPEFAVPALDALHEAGHDIAAVYTQPARPAGRGKRRRPSPVAERAAALGFPVRSPETLRDTADQADFAALAPEAGIIVAYGLILPRAILDAPPRGCLNIHASLLPRWRGAAPIQRAIMEGDAGTGISIMAVEAKLDAGPVLKREGIAIGETETAGELGQRLSRLGARLIVETLDEIDALIPELQPEAGVTHAAKIDKAEARIDWTRPAAEIDRLIRGLSPFPGAWTEIGGERVKFLRSVLADGSGTPGQALDDALTVACGNGALRILELQRPGRAPAPADAVLRGFAVVPGTRLG